MAEDSPAALAAEPEGSTVEEAPEAFAAADPIAAEIAAAATPPLASPAARLRVPATSAALKPVQPLAAGNSRWGTAAAEPSQDDERLKRKLTEAGKRLKALMDADASPPDPQGLEETPQLAYATPSEPKPAASTSAQEPFGDIAMVDARARSAVNFRSAAKKNASVLEVIPRGAAIKVAAGDCPGWCPIIYNGKKGYIYRDFVQHAAAAPAEPGQARPRNAQPDAPAAETSDANPAAADNDATQLQPFERRQGGH